MRGILLYQKLAPSFAFSRIFASGHDLTTSLSAIEALEEGILNWLARIDVVSVDFGVSCPAVFYPLCAPTTLERLELKKFKGLISS